MLIQQHLIHRHNAGRQGKAAIGHFGDFFHNHGVVNGILRIAAPAKGAVIIDKYAGNLQGVYLPKGINDHMTGVRFVAVLDFLGPWPWYIVAETAIAFSAWALLTLPFLPMPSVSYSVDRQNS